MWIENDATTKKHTISNDRLGECISFLYIDFNVIDDYKS
jgi:hypothetical protein